VRKAIVESATAIALASANRKKDIEALAERIHQHNHKNSQKMWEMLTDELKYVYF